MLDIEKQPSATDLCLQCPKGTLNYTPGFDDSVPNKHKALDALPCVFSRFEACPADCEAFFSHVESHFDVCPSTTNGSLELIKKEPCSLQKAGNSLEGIMREDRRNECKHRDGIGNLRIPLNELKECAGTHGPSSGYSPCRMGYYEGTRMERETPLRFGGSQILQRGIANAIDWARLKINSSNKCALKWHWVEEYSPSASRTQPRIGKGAQSVTHGRPFCRCYEQSSGRELGLVGVSCLILGKTMCPLLQWLCLQSLQSEPRSILDQSLIDHVPSLSQLVATSGRHHTVTLSMSLISISLTVLALFIPLSHISERCRSPVLICCWMAIVASGPLWTYIGGSTASFFLVFMPYAMSVGISIGLLWYRCARERDH